MDWEKVDSDMKEAGKAVSKKLEEQKNDERTQRIVNQVGKGLTLCNVRCFYQTS